MTKRVLLTGAAGFVGSHALRHLLKNTDYEIVCPMTFRHKGTQSRLALALDSLGDFDSVRHRVRTVMLDLTAPIDPVTDRLLGRIDYVLNFASESHVDRSITHPAPFILNNVALMTTLLDWCRHRQDADNGVDAFLQVSTDEVYGPAPEGTAHKEWQDISRPSNPYSASKAAQEAILFSYWRTYGIPVVITNTMNIIGETQDPEKFFPMVLRNVMAGERVSIHASATGQIGSRFYLHARNQADGVLFALDWALGRSANRGTTFHRQHPGGPSGGPDSEALRYAPGIDQPYRFHIVGEREVDNLEMAQMIAEAADRPLQYELRDFHSSRPGHDLRYALDGSRMQALGWKPPIPLEGSIRSTVDWTLRHPEWLH